MGLAYLAHVKCSWGQQCILFSMAGRACYEPMKCCLDEVSFLNSLHGFFTTFVSASL